jgi:hypothetical protein
MMIGRNYILLWVIMENGLVERGERYIESCIPNHRIVLDDEDEDNGQVKEEDHVKDMFYSI